MVRSPTARPFVKMKVPACEGEKGAYTSALDREQRVRDVLGIRRDESSEDGPNLGHCHVCGEKVAIVTFMGVPHCEGCAP